MTLLDYWCNVHTVRNSDHDKLDKIQIHTYNITVSTTAVVFLFPACTVTKWHHFKHPP